MTEPKRFFSLPLELRQLIYDGILPKDRFFTIDSTRSWPLHATMKAVCEADPRLKREFTCWMRKTCQLRVVITPHTKLPSEKFPWARLTGLESLIQHYDQKDEAASIEKLRENIAQFVALLAKYDRPRHVSIRFKDHGDSHGGDSFWCVQKYYHGGEDLKTRYYLAPMPSSKPKIPIVEYLLEPLLQLPVCKTADVKILEGLYSNPKHPDLFGDRGSFDNSYQLMLFDDFELWVEGARSAVFRQICREMALHR